MEKPSTVSLDYSFPGHAAKKFVCPSCHKKRFVRYVNPQSGEYYPEQFGRCDREDQCGYFAHPGAATKEDNDDYRARYLEDRYEVEPIKRDFNVVDRNTMVSTLAHFERNNLYQWFAQKLGTQRAYDLFWQFYAGTAKDGSTIFWQVDNHLNVRTANKVMYDGFRRHKERLPYRLYKVEDGYEPCLFGLHQLNGIGDKNSVLVCIVESEKTAMLCAAFMPTLPQNDVLYPVVWLASSGSNGLTRQKVDALSGFKVWLWPDFSWLSRATWGATPMREKEVYDPEFINPTNLMRGRTTRKKAPDGEIVVGYESAADRIEEAGADHVKFFDFCEDANDGSDIGDVLMQWDYALKEPVAFNQPNFKRYKLNKAGTGPAVELKYDEAKANFVKHGGFMALAKRFDLFISDITNAEGKTLTNS